MCGITGFIGAAGAALDSQSAVIRSMTDALAHRGPDAGATWISGDGTVSLGHRRLAIIDLSETGAQPMHTPDGRYTIVFNGEIYNYRELRSDLEAAGNVFRGESDTEVLLRALGAWGVANTLPRLNGMFAFALWDGYEKRLWLARDRFGEKPLYYGVCKGVFIFGSELKAFVRHPAFRRQIDRKALALYLRFNYVPSPYSIYEGVRKLPPAHYICVDANGQFGSCCAYWRLCDVLSRRRTVGLDRNDPALTDYIDQHLRRAVKLRMVADVPLGAFLSGGIDSSTIVALMQAQSSKPVRTFTVGFKESAYNEAADAAKVAKFLGTDHEEIYLSASEFSEVAARLPHIYDEPFADSSQIPTALVSSFTRRHVTVALSGDAGDEFWGGYNRYFWTERIWPLLGRLPRAARPLVANLIRSRSPAEWDRWFHQSRHFLPQSLHVRGGGEKIHKFATSLGAESSDELYKGFVSQWQEPREVLLDCDEPRFLGEHLEAMPSNLTSVERMMYLDAVTYLPDDILCKVDRAAMSVGLEARVPFLDNNLIEVSWSLPQNAKIYRGAGKLPLRRVLSRYLPNELFNRPKAGFGIPIGDWLRGDLRDWANDMLGSARLRRGGYFNPLVVEKLWERHLSGRANVQYALWGILMFESWLEAN